MKNFQERPELLAGPNPFIEAIPPFIPLSKLPAELSNSPLDHVDWRSIPPEYREPLLNYVESHFVPIRPQLDPASGMQNLVRRSLICANPLNQEVRKRVNRVALLEGVQDLEKMPKLTGKGELIFGMTGSGKSTLGKRSLDVFLPDQVILHGSSNVGGYYGLKQCTYLFIDHPSNGSRGGLLKRFLVALDDALGTSYSDDQKSTANLDSLLVVVCKLLVRHRVAIVFVDEHQEETLENSPWNVEFAQFYLTLMNLGVSVVLSGNPLAFENFFNYSQLMRRFSDDGVFHFEPAESQSDMWWRRDFIPQARKFSLVEEWSISDDLRAELEFKHSAGLPGLLMKYHEEVQRSALRRGGEEAVVSEKDFEAAAQSPRYLEKKRIASALSPDETETTAQFQYRDIPKRAQKFSGHRDEKDPQTESSLPKKEEIDVVKKRIQKFKKQQTRAINLLEKELEIHKNLEEDDIRGLGITKDLLKSMEARLTELKKSAVKH